MQENLSTWQPQASRFSFNFHIDLGDSGIGNIPITQQSDPYIEASKFCAKYQLNPIVITILGDSIRQQMIHQQSDLNASDLNKSSNTMPMRSKNHQQKLIQHQEQQRRQKTLRESQKQINIKRQHFQETMFTEMKTNVTQPESEYKYIQNYQSNQLNKKSHQFFSNLPPTIKSIYASKIVDLPNSQDETRKISKTKTSQKYDPFLHLYNNFKEIEVKKQLSRKKSYQSISFKPEINKISKRIVEGKRKSQKMKTVTEHSNIFYQKLDDYVLRNKVNSKNNSSHKTANNSRDKPQIKYSIQIPDKKIINKENQYAKILPHSKELAEKSRKEGFRQIFQELLKPGKKQLHYKDLNLHQMSLKQKLLLPIFNQMKIIRQSINQNQFVGAGMRLLEILPQNQKPLFRSLQNSRYSSKSNLGVKEQSKSKIMLNENSKKIIEKKGTHQMRDIYNRGEIFLRQSSQKRRKIRQDLERRNLANCSFQPKINPQMYFRI